MNCIEDCPEGAIHYGLARTRSSSQIPLDINRRRLIETAVAGVVLFPMMRSVVNAQSDPQHRVIRPPGSIAEDDFVRRCIKFRKSREIIGVPGCPHRIL